MEDADNLCNKSRTSMINHVNGTFLNNEIQFTGYPIMGVNHRKVIAGGCDDYHEKHEI